MSRALKNVVMPLGVLAIGVAALVYLLVSKEPPPVVDRQDEAPRVEVVPIEPTESAGFTIETNGVVVPKREVTLAAEIEGRVVERSDACWAGRMVEPGTPLLALDTQPLELRQATLEAEARQIEADLRQLEVERKNTEELIALAERELDLRTKERKRIERLAVQQTATESERDEALAQEIAARQSLQTLVSDRRTFDTRRERFQAQRERIQAQIEELEYDIARSEIAAPVRGILAEVMVEQGGYVRPGDALVRIEDATMMEVRCSLQMEDLFWLAGGAYPIDSLLQDPYGIPHSQADLTYKVLGQSRSWEARVARFDGSGLDERTRTVPIRLEVPEPQGLRRGMFVSIALEVENPAVPLLSVPRRGYRPNEVVWLVEDGRLIIRRVEVVRVLEDHVLIRADGPGEPIEPGSMLVVSPLQAPVNLMAVEAVEASELAGDSPALAELDPGAPQGP